jgi:hypothetical protein
MPVMVAMGVVKPQDPTVVTLVDRVVDVGIEVVFSVAPNHAPSGIYSLSSLHADQGHISFAPAGSDAAVDINPGV